ncbi:MAG: hypothetical protein WCK29_02440 [archaeon]
MSIANKTRDYIMPLAIAGAVALGGLEGRTDNFPVPVISDYSITNEVNGLGKTNPMQRIVVTNTVPGTNYCLLTRDFLDDSANLGHYWTTNQTKPATTNVMTFETTYNPNKNHQFFKVQGNFSTNTIPSPQ